MNDMTIDEMIKKFKEFHKMYEERIKEGKDVNEILDEFKNGEKSSRDRQSAKQILKFSKILSKYINEDFFENAYFYLNSLIEDCSDKYIRIDLNELNREGIFFNFLGSHLKNKHLEIDGSVGDFLGGNAENSIITVNGDAKNLAGFFMKYSEITLNGNAGDFVGENSRNSSIIVNGNSGDCVGTSAKNSKIIVNGNAGDSIGMEASNSKIYIKGNIERLPNYLDKSTEIYQMQNGIYVKVFPK